MKLKRFNEDLEYQQSDDEELADQYGVRDMTISGLIKIDDNEIIFECRDFDSELCHLKIDFNKRTMKVVKIG